MPITHAFVTPQADDGVVDEVGPNDWNDPHVGVGAQIMTVPLLNPTGLAEVTFNVNSTSYANNYYTSFWTDFTFVPWTHFQIFGYGRSNAAGQTITFQACYNGTTALSAAGNDVSVASTNAEISSGWVPITAIVSGLTRVAVLMKGSNTTVDFTYQTLGIQLKYDP